MSNSLEPIRLLLPGPLHAISANRFAPEFGRSRVVRRPLDRHTLHRRRPRPKNVNKNSFVHNSIPGSICYGDARDRALSDKAVAWECRNFDGAVTQCFSLRLDEAARELSGRMRGEAVDTDRED